MKEKLLLEKEDLIAIGIKENTAVRIIREGKQLMIDKGFDFYDNRRLGLVPTQAVEEILGISIMKNNGGKEYVC
ncbi:DUF3173 family protein [Vagococcus zengguangii]|uniref:DUF3173 family protein n=1 Tax=Vagococcus zengguangii TaxID=2571750 RepID=UPI0011086D46|nr:DUF3173 family protein [Vagococcus zengguangii]TLG78298.1 DUF3173 domain-containing protein [Vagococcus zengguangii]